MHRKTGMGVGNMDCDIEWQHAWYRLTLSSSNGSPYCLCYSL